MQNYLLTLPTPFALVIIGLGILGVGLVDYATGNIIHVVSLYFVPLALAGWRFGRSGAVLASLLCVAFWLGALYATSAEDMAWYIWFINFLTQSAAFLTVALLMAALAVALRKEQTLSRTDALTGLKNRRAFVEDANIVLSRCRRHAHPVSLAFIDLDDFKRVNDSLGHAAGDDCLRKCGEVIRESMRAGDIAARLGGDEFVIFLPETTARQAAASMERIRKAIGSSVQCCAVGVTVSIGVVFDATARLDIEDLLRRADSQMYRVKRSTKNRVQVLGLELLAAS